MGLKELQEIRANRDRPKEKKFYRIPPKSAKRLISEKIAKEQGTDEGMDKFFEAMRKKMKGRCLFCGGVTSRDSDDSYRNSIAHLLPKAIFKSVAVHEENWIELCFYQNSCHTNFDTGKITWEFIKDSKEWDIVKEKLLSVLPMVAIEERKNKLYDKLIKLVYEN